jgi:NADPH:quinone reductase-like Zn-dependent oxidoreductase
MRSRQPAVREARRSFATPSAQIAPKQRCAPLPGRAVTWLWVFLPEFQIFRLIYPCSRAARVLGEFTTRQPDLHRANVEKLMQLYLAGHIKPAVPERYPLARGADAIARLGTRQALGKIAVTL